MLVPDRKCPIFGCCDKSGDKFFSKAELFKKFWDESGFRALAIQIVTLLAFRSYTLQVFSRRRYELLQIYICYTLGRLLR